MANGRFSGETIETLGRRAALSCSNPDCSTLTSGPSSDDRAAVNIGEAAHIYGLTPNSARFNKDLSIEELSDITNGIWLCRNCHKLIDNDPTQYPAELLFNWRRRHEAVVLARVGKPGEKLREKLKQEELGFFADTSYLAQQIIIDRPPRWEYKLAAEILRAEMGAVLIRWRRLQDGMYTLKGTKVPTHEIYEWFSAKNRELSKVVDTFTPLLDALTKSFGPPGTPGDAREILEVCRLLTAAAQNLLQWEEEVRFTYVDEKFADLLTAMAGAGGHVLQEIFQVQTTLAKFVDENTSGYHSVTITITLPEGYVENVKAAFRKTDA